MAIVSLMKFDAVTNAKDTAVAVFLAIMGMKKSMDNLYIHKPSTCNVLLMFEWVSMKKRQCLFSTLCENAVTTFGFLFSNASTMLVSSYTL